VTLENGNAKPIGRIGGPVDPQFLINYGDTYHDSRFNGHEPGTDPKDQYGRWYENPEMAYMALIDAIFVPRLTFNHRKATRIDQPDMLELWIELATFLDGKSKLQVQLWRANNWKLEKENEKKRLTRYADDKVIICTGEGSGPKTIRVEWPIAWDEEKDGIEHVCALVRMDVKGNNKFWLPVPPGEKGEKSSDEDKLWVDEWTVLRMHARKRELLQVEKAQHAHRKRLEKYIKKND
jgi:hypothetical protein